jgi:aryl-alcohol dehydrogenase-like predicted oxidoreductase
LDDCLIFLEESVFCPENWYKLSMDKRKFGSNDFYVSPLGLGIAALGRPGYINLGHADDLENEYDVKDMEERTHTTLDAAWAGGIRYFDVARSYGKAEAFLGSWLRSRNIDPGSIIVGSKWGYTYTADWQVTVAEDQAHEVKEHSLPVLQRQIVESRSFLGSYLSLYQIHSATLESKVLENPSVLAELARIKGEGLAIGLTTSGSNQPETIWKALEVTVDGEPLFSSVQSTWNLLEQSAGKALTAAHEAGFGVIIKETLANGRLTGRNDSPEFRTTLALLTSEANKRQTTVDALALAAVLQQPFVDLALSGAVRADHLESNLQAVRIARGGSLEELLDQTVQPAEDYWNYRSNMKWN